MDFQPSIFQSKPISKNSLSLYKKQEHVLLGISPFNSYYSEQIIKSQILWAETHFESFNIFIPDTLPIHTFLALGYTTARATKKASRQAAYLKNKIIKALSSLHFSGQLINEIIIDMELLDKNQNYQKIKSDCYDLYQNNFKFRKTCDDCTEWVLGGHQIKDETNYNPKLAVHYILNEMPLFINTPLILNLNTSLFVYHQTPELLNYLHNESNQQNFVSVNQGYIELSLNLERSIKSNGVLTTNEKSIGGALSNT